MTRDELIRKAHEHMAKPEFQRELVQKRWRNRVAEALADGLALDGNDAVHAAVHGLLDRLDITAPRGAPRGPLPDGVAKAARYLVDHDFEPTTGRLAQVAGVAKQAMARWKKDPRFMDAVADYLCRQWYDKSSA